MNDPKPYRSTAEREAAGIEDGPEGTTGIFVRGQDSKGNWGNIDIANLDAESLVRWLRSRPDPARSATQVVMFLFGHDPHAIDDFPADDTEPAENKASCDLCGDVGTLTLHGRCHPTAPVRMELDGGVLTVRCYVPECQRLIAKFNATLAPADPVTPRSNDIRDRAAALLEDVDPESEQARFLRAVRDHGPTIGDLIDGLGSPSSDREK